MLIIAVFLWVPLIAVPCFVFYRIGRGIVRTGRKIRNMRGD